MKRGSILLVSTITLALFLIPFSSADIFFGQVHSLYNLGDLINANVTISSNLESVGFLTSSIICGINEIETYRSIEVLSPDQEKTIPVVAVVDPFLVGNLEGECYLRALYGAGEARSQAFTISKQIDVEARSSLAVADPGETITISGTAIKRNREPLEGFVDILIIGEELKLPDPELKTILQSQLDSTNDITEESTTKEVTTEEESGEENPSEPIDDSTEDPSSESMESEEETTEENPDEPEETEEKTTEVSSEPPKSVEESSKEEAVTEGVVTSVNNKIIIGSIFADVTEGAFSQDFTIPTDAPSGSYQIIAKVSDISPQGIILSTGEAISSVRVRPIIQNLDIILSTESIAPERSISYRPIILDQAKAIGEGEIQITLFNPDKESHGEELITSGESHSIYIEANSTAGFWEFQARFQDLEKTRQFFVEEFEKIIYSLKEGILTVSNQGNIPFRGPVELTIGNTSKILELDLSIGESNQFKLEAPDGEYLVQVNNGESTQDLGTSFLTGRAVGVDQLGGIFFSSRFSVWIWTLLIVILLIIVLILLRKILKKKYIGKIPKTVTPPSQTFTRKASNVKPGPIQALPTLSTVMAQGSKEEASIIALKLKNLKTLERSPASSNSPLETINKALLKAKSKGAKIYVDKEYRIIIFSPELTKTNENEVTSVSVAKEIESILSNFNTTSAQKINFGLGVHTGPMALESDKSSKKVKFVSLGNTISIAKRAAEHSSSSVLISEPMHKKTRGKLKVERLSDTGFWTIKSMPRREQHKDFINNFLKRQKKG